MMYSISDLRVGAGGRGISSSLPHVVGEMSRYETEGACDVPTSVSSREVCMCLLSLTQWGRCRGTRQRGLPTVVLRRGRRRPLCDDDLDLRERIPQKRSLSGAFWRFTIYDLRSSVPQTGIEPALPAPEAGALSPELLGRTQIVTLYLHLQPFGSMEPEPTDSECNVTPTATHRALRTGVRGFGP